MNKYLKIVIFGFIIWLVPFIVSFFIYPLKTAGSPLFESIMPTVISVIVVMMAYSYLKNIEMNLIREGVFIGVSWFIISIVIDLVLFLPPSPMRMSFANYVEDIGITYFMIPIITIGLAYMADKKIQTGK